MVSTVYFCDVCKKVETKYEGPLFIVKDKAKIEGWKAFKGRDGSWQHSCPMCSQG